MNIIVPNMMQNALTEEDDGGRRGRRRGGEDQDLICFSATAV